MTENQFQIYECQNPLCRFRCPSNLSVESISHCPACGSELLPSGLPFSNLKYQTKQPHQSNRQVSILLDNLRSTLNVGSIFRTADGAGASHIYCCGTTPTPEHPKIIKTGLGAEDFIPWSYHPNALDVFNQIDGNLLIITLEASDQSADLFATLSQIENDRPVLLILGNEVSGVDPELIKRSDLICSLPMIGRKTSLNVAVAAGIALYMLRFVC